MPDLPPVRAKSAGSQACLQNAIIPGRSLSHGFQTRILDETSIQLKLYFLTNFPTLTQISPIY